MTLETDLDIGTDSAAGHRSMEMTAARQVPAYLGGNTTRYPEGGWEETPHRTAMDVILLYLAVTLMVIIIVMGTAGNILVIAAVKATKRLRSPSNLLIFNLSVCDLIFVTAVLPFNIYTYLVDGWFLDINLCKFVGFLGYSLTGTIIISISLIAWNRFKLVMDPGGYKAMFTTGRLVGMLAASWVLPVLCLLPSVLELWGQFGYVAMLVTCNLLLSHRSQSFKLALLMIRALLPVVLLVYCYFMIYRLSRQSRAKLHHYGIWHSTAYRKHSKRNERHLSRMILAIFLVFGCSYFPCAVTGLVDWGSVLSKNYHMYCEITVYIGSAINPLIYGLMNSQFRDAYLAILCGDRKRLKTMRVRKPHAPQLVARRRSSLLAAAGGSAKTKVDWNRRAVCKGPLRLPPDSSSTQCLPSLCTTSELDTGSYCQQTDPQRGAQPLGGRRRADGFSSCSSSGDMSDLQDGNDVKNSLSETDSNLPCVSASSINSHRSLGCSPTSSCASGVTDSTVSSFCQ